MEVRNERSMGGFIDNIQIQNFFVQDNYVVLPFQYALHNM